MNWKILAYYGNEAKPSICLLQDAENKNSAILWSEGEGRTNPVSLHYLNDHDMIFRLGKWEGGDGNGIVDRILADERIVRMPKNAGLYSKQDYEKAKGTEKSLDIMYVLEGGEVYTQFGGRLIKRDEIAFG